MFSGLLVFADVRTISPRNVKTFSAEDANIFVVDAHFVAPDMLVETRLLVEELSAGFTDKLLFDMQLVVFVERLLLTECLAADVTLKGTFV